MKAKKQDRARIREEKAILCCESKRAIKKPKKAKQNLHNKIIEYS